MFSSLHAVQVFSIDTCILYIMHVMSCMSCSLLNIMYHHAHAISQKIASIPFCTAAGVVDMTLCMDVAAGAPLQLRPAACLHINNLLIKRAGACSHTRAPT